MNENRSLVTLSVGISIFLGLAVLGYFINKATINFKSFDRSITVKGLAEQEHIADIVIWPIQFTEASNTLDGVYESLDQSAELVNEFLVSRGIAEDEISFSTPLLTDRSAQRYGGNENFQYRYIASQTATIYSENVETLVRIIILFKPMKKSPLTRGDLEGCPSGFFINLINIPLNHPLLRRTFDFRVSESNSG